MTNSYRKLINIKESEMKVKINIMKDFFAAAIIILLVCSFSLFFLFTNVHEVYAQEKYDYFGYVPAKMYQYNLTVGDDPNSGWRLDTNSTGTSGITTAGLVAVVGIVDGTHVEVYSVDNGSLVSEATIGSMQKFYAVFRNGTFFRVETDKLANVYLLNYGSVPAGNATSGPLPDSFYQSTSGTYVGKEFVLLGSGSGYTIGYAIFALENAEVTVTRNDSIQQQYKIPVNTWKEILWQPFFTYKIVSTGYIMIQSGRPVDIWGDARSFFLPSAEGGFVGNTFYSWSQPSWDPTETYGFRASATQDAKITVLNLETKQQILTANIQAGSGVSFKPSANAIVVQSDKPITLQYLHNGSIANSQGHNGTFDAYGSGVAYLGVKPDEDTPFYLPDDSTNEAYIFASENTDITLDDNEWTIQANTYFSLSIPGTHIIRANKNAVVETLNWPGTPPYQGLVYDGVQIPSVQTVNVVVDVTLTPLGEAIPIMYIIIGAAATVISVIVVFIFMRGRGKK
jgi:hypothetical protein